MAQNQNPAETLHDIKQMMEKSSKFISLNGFSGVFIGLLTIITVGLFCNYYSINPFNGDMNQLKYLPKEHYLVTLVAAFALFTLSVIIATVLTVKRARKLNIPTWGPASKRLMINFTVPLGLGGLFCLIMFFQHADYILPLSLIFYGMALFNAGNFTFTSTKYIGVIQMVMGVSCLLLLNYHILIWTIGFGLVHIIYGIYMYFATK